MGIHVRADYEALKVVCYGVSRVSMGMHCGGGEVCSSREYIVTKARLNSDTVTETACHTIQCFVCYMAYILSLPC